MKKRAWHFWGGQNYCSKAMGVLVFVLILLPAPFQCKAQFTNTGTIDGTIYDQSGAFVAGVNVTITNAETGTATHNGSNSSGRFSQVGLPPGNYEVTVSSPGFGTLKETGIHLDPAGTYTVNVTLKPGATTSTVTVTGSAAQVETTTSEISNTVSGEEVETLPLNGRNFQQLGSLMPGVINTSPASALLTGGFITSNYLNVNGGGAKGSLYTIDGIWNENTGNMTQTTIMPNPDEIAEVKVLQNNFSAQYSLMGASVVTVQTKSGTGTYHGVAWEFLRNTALNATNYFAKKPSVLHQNIYGGALGGPFFIPHLFNTTRDKAFFLYEPAAGPVHAGPGHPGSFADARDACWYFSDLRCVRHGLPEGPYPSRKL
jgi:Carboxypeptidase regulatory-like domain/TonB-dependent Receptor Plug Domain